MTKLFRFAFLLPAAIFSQIPQNYYAGTENLGGYALKTKLHEIISKKIYSYHYSDIAGFYAYTDLDKYYENDGSVLDIYSERPFGPDAYNYILTQNISGANAEGQGWNKEHGMPQSTFYGIYPMFSDLHYLIPADAFINQRRSNYPYARNNGSSYTFSNGSKLGKSTTPGYSHIVYEPIDEFKGDVARYLLYFAVRYEGSLNMMNYALATSPLDGTEEKAYEDWYLSLLKEWSALDPVSQKEIDRNNAVYQIQKVRNPFIDHPEWVNLIWSENTDAVAPHAPKNLGATASGASFIRVAWQPSEDADVLGYKVYVDGNYYTYTKTNSAVIDRLNPSTSYTISVKAYDKGYLHSPETTIAASTEASDAFAKDLMISKYIEGTDNNTAVEIINKTGHDVELKNYFLSIQYRSSTNFYFAEPYQLEGVLAAGKSAVVVHPNSKFSNYPIRKADFVTNAPPMTFSGTQYIELAYGKKYLKTESTQNYAMSYTTVDAVGVRDMLNANSDVSLYRNSDVQDPTPNFSLSEWTAYPIDFADGLGQTLAAGEAKVSTLFIYPNPVREKLYFANENMVKTPIEIYDFSGRLVLKVNRITAGGTDVKNLQAGNYIVKANGISRKFTKE